MPKSSFTGALAIGEAPGVAAATADLANAAGLEGTTGTASECANTFGRDGTAGFGAGCRLLSWTGTGLFMRRGGFVGLAGFGGGAEAGTGADCCCACKLFVVETGPGGGGGGAAAGGGAFGPLILIAGRGAAGGGADGPPTAKSIPRPSTICSESGAPVAKIFAFTSRQLATESLLTSLAGTAHEGV